MDAKEFAKLRNKVTDTLISDGWDYDDARFATMMAGAEPAELLSDQPSTKTHPALVALAAVAANVEPASVIPVVDHSADWWEWFNETDGIG